MITLMPASRHRSMAAWHLGARRILEADEAAEDQILLLQEHGSEARGFDRHCRRAEVRPTGGMLSRWSWATRPAASSSTLAPREGEHAQAVLAGHRVLRGGERARGARSSRGRRRPPSAPTRAQRQHALRRALAVEQPARRRRVAQHGHPLAVRVERNLVHALACSGTRLRHGVPRARRARSPSDRRAASAAPSSPRLFTSWQQRRISKNRWPRRAAVRWRAGTFVGADIRHPRMHSRRADMRFCGERAGLVGADDRGRTQRLDRGQMAHQRVASSPCAGSPSRATA